MSKSTRSKVTLTGQLRDYSLESVQTMSSERGDRDEALAIEEAQDIKSLLSLMTKTLTVVSASASRTTSGDQQSFRLEDCPIKRASSSLDAWIDEVLLWDDCNSGASEALRAKKYLKFVDSVRKSEECKDLQNLIEIEFVENHAFDKKGELVIKTIVEKVRDKLGQSDIEKCSDAWLDFINIKQEQDESAQSFVTRFEKVEASLRNSKIVIPNKALAIHLMNKSSMEQQSKENVLTKTNVNDEKEIYESMKKSIREMKGNLTRNEKVESKAIENNKTFFGSSEDRMTGRSRSKSKFNPRESRNRSKSRSGREPWKRDYRGDSRKRNERSFSRNRDSYRSFRDQDRKGHRGGSYRRDRRSERSKGRSGSHHSRNGGKKNSSDEVNVVHFSEYKDNYESNDEFIKDTIENCDDLDRDIIEIVYKEGTDNIDPYRGIVDSGCPRTVSGKPWMDAFIESKGDDIKVTRRKENQYFKFGPSEVYKSSENFEIDVVIGDLKDKIRVSVVETNVPLLIGLDYQKKWGMVIDLGENEIHIRKSNQTFRISQKNNHWTLPIQNESLHGQARKLVFHVELEKLNDHKLRKHIVKIHKNLAQDRRATP